MTSADPPHRRPQVSIVVFDSRAPVGAGGSRAVYMAGTAAEVRDDDLDGSLAAYTVSPTVGDGSSRQQISRRRPRTGSTAPPSK